MQLGASALAAFVAFSLVECSILRSSHTRSRSGQEPDTSCGKGFDNIVQGSQEYYKTAFDKLWSHPAHQMDKSTFNTEFKCWFANMMTTKCGGLPSQADTRKKKLSEKCLDPKTLYNEVWSMFSMEELKYFKTNYPAEEDTDSKGIYFKQVMHTAKELNMKEVLCLTLFAIDDECVKWPYIRLG